MTRVIHTGDTHLGYRQYHLAERREDFLAAFRRVVEDAVADDVDAVVHAGDLFHDRRPDLPDLLGTIDVLRELRDADVPFLAVVGNHEGTRSAQWLDLFETLGLATRLDETGSVMGDTAFYGLDYAPRSRRDDLEYAFEPCDADHAALVSHGRFTPFAHADWETETVLDAADVAFDAVLLGDVHQPGRDSVDGVPVTYCGSTERASADERDPRGYNIVTFDGDAEITRRGIETRPFVFVDVELGEGEGTGRLRQRLREEVVEDAVVIVTVEGGGEEVTPAEVERLGEERGALLTRVNDRREREPEASAPAVQFADPDEAVRERVREMGLSDVARAVDGRVRDGELAKTNVRDAVEEAVRDRIDDPDAFEPADDTGADDADDGAVDADEDSTSDAGDDAGDTADDAAPDGEPVPGDAKGDAEAASDGGAVGDEATGEEATPDEPTGDDPAADEPTADDGGTGDADDQSTMGEYL